MPERLPRPDRAAVAAVVRGVVAAAVRDAGAAGVALAAHPGPERDLLAAWLPDARLPDASLAGRLAEAAGPVGREEAWRSAARLRAAAEDLLTAGTGNKTLLLLGRERPGVDLLPFGDLWATQLRALAGAATLPPSLEGAGEEEVEAVDAALAAWLERGRPLLPQDLPPGRAAAVERSLRGAHPYGRPAVVAKLGRWTAGIDLAL